MLHTLARLSSMPLSPLTSHLCCPACPAGANGRLLENPYYLTGMVVLLVFFFSLGAPVAEFRYSLCMISCKLGLPS